MFAVVEASGLLSITNANTIMKNKITMLTVHHKWGKKALSMQCSLCCWMS